MHPVTVGYRVATDSDNVVALFFELTKMGFRVFFDQVRLEDGKNWEIGFCNGLIQSKVFVGVLSGAGLYSGTDRGDISKLKADSPADNVMLEHALVGELKERDLIEEIFVVPMDDKVSAEAAPDIAVALIDAKLVEHLKREDLGDPKQAQHYVKKTVQGILNGTHLTGASADNLGPVATALEQHLLRLKCEPRFEVCISYRGNCKDDLAFATRLHAELCRKGVRAFLAAASVEATSLLLFKPLVFVVIESAAAFTPLSLAHDSKEADPVAVEWSFALWLQQNHLLDFIYPILLGEIDVAVTAEQHLEVERNLKAAEEAHTTEKSEKTKKAVKALKQSLDEQAYVQRNNFAAWSAGSPVVVDSVSAQVAALAKQVDAKLAAPDAISSKAAIGAINIMQGQKIGGAPDNTLESAVIKIRQILSRTAQGQAADEQLHEKEIALAHEKREKEQAQREKEQALKREKQAQKATEEALAENEELKAAMKELQARFGSMQAPKPPPPASAK